jgi:hypothetical protein
MRPTLTEALLAPKVVAWQRFHVPAGTDRSYLEAEVKWLGAAGRRAMVAAAPTQIRSSVSPTVAQPVLIGAKSLNPGHCPKD